MTVVLDVEPAAYTAAAQLLGGEVADCVRLAWVGLTAALDGTYGMAGSDPAGTAWGGAYDKAATAATGATTDVINACYRMAALLEQTGSNYAAAESASVIGGGAVALRTHGAHTSIASLNDVESAIGIGVPAPGAWARLQHAIGAMWPDGHQDRLHHAASAWHRAGSQLLSLLSDIDRAAARLTEQRAPEVHDAVLVVNGMHHHVAEVAGCYHSLGDACSDYAQHIDQAHHGIVQEIKSFIEWSVGIEAAGAGFALITLGASEAAAQAAELAEISRAAAAITAIIDRLVTLARTLSSAVTVVTARITETAAAVQRVLARQLEEARLTGSDTGAISFGGLPTSAQSAAGAGATAATKAEASAAARLTDEAAVGPASETWANPRSLRQHYIDHAADFGSSSKEEYARDAALFYRRAIRDKLPMKLDRADATVRCYDPESNTFGSYRLDGKARTFFKPDDREHYWDIQPGELRK